MYQQPKLYDEVFSYRDFDAEAAFVRAAYKRHCPGRPLGALLELGCAHSAELLGQARSRAFGGWGLLRFKLGQMRSTSAHALDAASHPAPPFHYGRCGPARHAALLAKAGGRLWALDASEPMLAYARQLAQDAGADVTFVQGDMAGFDIEVGGGARSEQPAASLVSSCPHTAC